LYEFAPSGNFNEFHAMAIGARSQSARTYLERQVAATSFADGIINSGVIKINLSAIESLEGLIMHALMALRETLPPDFEPGLTPQNTAVGHLGIDVPFRIIESEEEIRAHLDKLPPPPARPSAEAAVAEEPTQQMQVD